MSGYVEQRLGETLARRADELGCGPRFSAEDVVRAGRVALRRRRAIRIASAAVGVVSVLVVVGAVAAAGGQDRKLPAGPPTLTQTPAPSTSAPSASASASAPSTSAPAGLSTAALGLDVLSGNVILRSDGRRVTLALPAEVSTDAATRVPGGWVLATHDAASAAYSSALWFAPDAGPVQRIVGPADSYQVSADGGVLVAAGGLLPGGTSPTVTAFELPSLRMLGQTSFDSAFGPVVAGISGDRVVLYGAQGAPGDSTAAVWNLRTGTLRPTSQPIWTWGVSRNGTVLRRVDRHGPGGAKDVTAACIDVVTIGDSMPTGQTGLCATWLAKPEGSGQLSPDGTWTVLSTTTPTSGEPAIALVRATDLHAGRWRPVAVNLPAGSTAEFWDTNETVIFSVGGGSSTLYRCASNGSCVPVAMPAELSEPRLVRPPGS
jgi:hypothetical protein